MESAARAFFELAFDDPFFRIVLTSTAVLILIAVIFASLALILRMRHDRRLRRKERLESQWEEHLFAVLAGREELRTLIDSVHRRDRVSYLDLLYRLGRHLQGDDLDVVRAAAEPYLDEIASSLGNRDTETRAKHLQMLGVLGFRNHHDVIRRSLDDPSPMVAMVAARALMRRGRHEYAADVLRRFSRFEDWSESTLSSLLAVMGTGAAPALREVFGSEDEPLWIRVTACRALEKLNDLKSADLAADLVNGEPEPELLRAAIDLLGQVGRGEHITLVRSYCEAADQTVRISAIGSLGRLSASTDTEALLLSIGDESPWVAMNAARSLKHLARRDLLRELAASGHQRAELLEQVLLES